jgi:hypothetical protein
MQRRRGGLASFEPEDPSNFSLEVAAEIGAAGEEGSDLFYFSVRTARALEHDPPPKGFEFLHGHVLLNRWSYELLLRAIGDLCSKTEGDDWNELATKLSRYGRWEFEDYRS